MTSAVAVKLYCPRRAMVMHLMTCLPLCSRFNSTLAPSSETVSLLAGEEPLLR